MSYRTRMLFLIMSFWFTISFITNILGPLIPDMVSSFELTDLALAGFIPTSFFLAYALMSIPTGMLTEKIGEKPILIIGFILPLIATILFGVLHTYLVLLLSSFLLGIGMAMLQTVLNPLQRAVAGEEHYAFIAIVAQFVFGIASFLSPRVYGYLVHHLTATEAVLSDNLMISFFRKITPPDMPWVSLYWIFSALLLVALLVTLFVRFPSLETSDESLTGSSSYCDLFKQPLVWLFFIGIFSYVASEQGISIFVSTFLEKIHDVDPRGTGAIVVSWFWGMMTIGCIVGMVLLKLFDSRKLLRISGIISILLLAFGLWGSRLVAIIAFPSIGFSISMMFGVVFSLALNSVSNHHGAFAGILCSAIVGGAAGPLFISIIADYAGIRAGLCLPFLFLAYITVIGYWAKPLVNNKTMSFKEMLHLNKS